MLSKSLSTATTAILQPSLQVLSEFRLFIHFQVIFVARFQVFHFGALCAGRLEEKRTVRSLVRTFLRSKV
jgi:hypothetical protein